MVKGMSDRDTQFQGFAKLLMSELLTHFGDFEDMERIIARRAYDLVEHTIEHMRPYIYGEQVAGQECVSDVPDLTEWAKEQE